MGVTEQLAYVAEFDPLVAKYPQANLTTNLTTAATRLSRRHYGTMYDQAVALLAAHIVRRTNPNIGPGQLVSNEDPVGGGARRSASNLPPGYPADWYTTPPGEQLIGLTSTLTPPTWG